MKSPILQRPSHKIMFVGLMLLVVLILSSCARKIRFENSAVVPAAQGFAKVDRDANKNYHIQLSLAHLAAPDRLQPARNTYVVWMSSNDEVSKNIGQIKTSSGLLGGKLKSSFETVSTVKPTRIFITAENDGQASFPSEQIILTTGNF